MKKLILTYLLMTATLLCIGQTDCDKFKKGTFTYKEEPFTSVIVTRTKKKQTEHDTKSGITITYKVRWTGDCQYELIQKGSNNTEVIKYNGSIIKAKITNTFANSYEVVAEYNGQVATGTMERMVIHKDE